MKKKRKGWQRQRAFWLAQLDRQEQHHHDPRTGHAKWDTKATSSNTKKQQARALEKSALRSTLRVTKKKLY